MKTEFPSLLVLIVFVLLVWGAVFEETPYRPNLQEGDYWTLCTKNRQQNCLSIHIKKIKDGYVYYRGWSNGYAYNGKRPLAHFTGPWRPAVIINEEPNGQRSKTTKFPLKKPRSKRNHILYSKNDRTLSDSDG